MPIPLQDASRPTAHADSNYNVDGPAGPARCAARARAQMRADPVGPAAWERARTPRPSQAAASSSSSVAPRVAKAHVGGRRRGEGCISAHRRARPRSPRRRRRPFQPPRTIPSDLRANLAGRLHASSSRPAARRHLGGLAMRGRSEMSLML